MKENSSIPLRPPIPRCSFYHKKKKSSPIGASPKGQFSKNTVYLERGIPYFAFVGTNAVPVRKNDKS